MLAAVDELLARIDALDGDPDLEDGADVEHTCEDEGFDSDSEAEIAGDATCMTWSGQLADPVGANNEHFA